MDELPIPSQVNDAERAMEMTRIWLADGEQIVVLNPNLWDDAGAWGLMLADLAHHVAAAYKEQGHDPQKVLERIRAAFDAEWEHPTS